MERNLLAVCGGFLVGAVELFEAAAARQEALVMNNMPGLTWEVNYWAMMEENFLNYSANHDDSIVANVCQFIIGRGEKIEAADGI